MVTLNGRADAREVVVNHHMEGLVRNYSIHVDVQQTETELRLRFKGAKKKHFRMELDKQSLCMEMEGAEPFAISLSPDVVKTTLVAFFAEDYLEVRFQVRPSFEKYQYIYS